MQNKRQRLWEGLLVMIFCLFLGGMLLCFLFLPKESFSANEKRYLTSFPSLSWQGVLSGRFGEEAERYAADHLPFRNGWVMGNAYWDLYTGRQTTKEIYVARGDRLVERPVLNSDHFIKNLAQINRFQELLGQPIDILLVPNAGYFMEEDILGLHDSYGDETYFMEIERGANEDIRFFDIREAFSQHASAYFYRTDHHWTSAGAYAAYQIYMTEKEKAYREKDAFTIETVPGFYGSTYARSALWGIPPENLEIWEDGTAVSVFIEEHTLGYDTMFFRNRLQEIDPYMVFLDGNHSVVRIQNHTGEGKGKLLLIRDSFGNSLAPFLALGYEEIVLIDLRYYKSAVVAMAKEEEFDDILLLYGLNYFVEDTNLAWLQ